MKNRRKLQPLAYAKPAASLPTTLAEAVAFLNVKAAPKLIAEIKATPFEALIDLHREIGMQVRDALGLWGRNPALIQSLPAEDQWPDNASMYIVQAWWQFLRTIERSHESHDR